MPYGCMTLSILWALAPSIRYPFQGLATAQGLTKPTVRQFPFFPSGIGGREFKCCNPGEQLSNLLSAEDFFVRQCIQNSQQQDPQRPQSTRSPSAQQHSKGTKQSIALGNT